jgi:Zn finger protein HypA/HybF involved in hydrogenase expression
MFAPNPSFTFTRLNLTLMSDRNYQRERKTKKEVKKLLLTCQTCGRALETEHEIMYGCFLCKQDEKRKPLDIDDLID